jgi:putative ABC transport system permease protein
MTPERNQQHGLARDEARGLPSVERLWHAAWQAWRAIANGKVATVFAALAFAVGIGSATAIYSVVNAVMLKPLPYSEGERFVALFAGDTRFPDRFSNLPSDDARTYEERTGAFDAFGWFREAGKNLTFGGEAHHVHGVAVTIPFVQHLGVQPVLGQWFRDLNGVVISTSLWRRLGENPAIIGQALALDGQVYTVTGVMPPSFHLPVAGITSVGLRADVWMPLDPGERAGAAYVAYARKRPGVTWEAAEADVKRVAAQIATERPRNREGYTARLFPLRETVVRDIRPTLLLLLAAAGLLFLIACANAAGLLLARSVARARETTVRVALGATRGQLALQYLAEGVSIALIGAAGGVFLALTVTPAVVSLAANYLPRAEEVTIDWTVLVFVLGAVGVASVLSSLAPLRQALRVAPSDALVEGVRASAGRRSRRTSQSLVVAEIALAFALLAVSAVLIAHLRTLYGASPGFQADGLVTFSASLPGSIANDAAKRRPLQQRLVDALHAIPGVEGVAFANLLPFKDCCRATTIYAEGRPPDPSPLQRASLMAVSTNYFATMKIPLRRGRFLAPTDEFVSQAPVPVVISEAAVQQYFGGGEPLGAFLRLDNPAGRRYQVVGVAGNVTNNGLNEPSIPEVYLPAFFFRIEGMRFIVRSSRSPASLLPDLRQAIRNVDPELPVHQTAAMREVMQQTITLERTAFFLTAFFAAAALVMAMLGVYTILAYSIRQRRVEIGVRMALGAASRDVLSLVVGTGLRLAAYGVLTGALLAVAGTLYLRSVFQIDAIGPVPILLSAGIVVAVACAASLVPAWRAALLSPLVAIRTEG